MLPRRRFPSVPLDRPDIGPDVEPVAPPPLMNIEHAQFPKHDNQSGQMAGAGIASLLNRRRILGKTSKVVGGMEGKA